jgi:hypothetical protein
MTHFRFVWFGIKVRHDYTPCIFYGCEEKVYLEPGEWVKRSRTDGSISGKNECDESKGDQTSDKSQ